MAYTGSGAEVVAALLAARFPGVPADVGGMSPAQPDLRMAVIDGVSQPMGRSMDGQVLSNPGVQVRVRGADAAQAVRQANAVRAFLLTVVNNRVEVQGPAGDAPETAEVAVVSVPADPTFLGTEPGDQNNRQVYVVNCSLAYKV